LLFINQRYCHKIFKTLKSKYFYSLTRLNNYPKFKYNLKDQSLYSNVKFIEIFGLIFEFKVERGFYRLYEIEYDALELVVITEGFFRYMNSINERGYIREVSLEDSFILALDDSFILDIHNHFFSLGFDNKKLGNSETTYTIWYKFIFVNLYYLIVKKLKEVKEHG